MRLVRDLKSDTFQSILSQVISVINVNEETPTQGRIAYNSNTGTIYYGNGSQWNAIGGNGNATSIQNVPVSATPPTTGQTLVYNGTSWVPTTGGGTTVTMGGDVTGPSNSSVISALKGVPLSSVPPTSGQVLSYNGTQWIPVTIPVNNILWVYPTYTTSQIQAALDQVIYNIVAFVPGTYNLTAGLIIRRNDLDVWGNNANLFLNNGVEQPVLFLGDLTSYPPTITYSNINVSGFNIDGNKANQASEKGPLYPPSWNVYNNGITISQCDYVTVNKCAITSCRSGGIVWTLNSVNLEISGCSSTNNYFDGIAGYTSSYVKVIDNRSYNNTNGAGISLDNNNENLIITGNNFSGNNVGIFARWTNDTQVNNNIISSNIGNGLFLSGYNSVPDNNINRWTISNNNIFLNGQQGLYLQSVTNTSIVGNVISQNVQNGINITSYGLTPQNGVSQYVNISSNIVTANSNVGFYNDASNSAGNGAVGNALVVNTILNNVNAQVVGDLTAWAVLSP